MEKEGHEPKHKSQAHAAPARPSKGNPEAKRPLSVPSVSHPRALAGSAADATRHASTVTSGGVETGGGWTAGQCHIRGARANEIRRAAGPRMKEGGGTGAPERRGPDRGWFWCCFGLSERGGPDLHGETCNF